MWHCSDSQASPAWLHCHKAIYCLFEQCFLRQSVSPAHQNPLEVMKRHTKNLLHLESTESMVSTTVEDIMKCVQSFKLQTASSFTINKSIRSTEELQMALYSLVFLLCMLNKVEAAGGASSCASVHLLFRVTLG